MDNRLTTILGYLGLLAAILVGIGEYLLHYSPNVLENAKDYKFLQDVSLDNLKTGHFFAMVGLPFYFAGYIHIYRMLRTGSENLARTVLAFGFVAFAVGGVWIGSRGFLGSITHYETSMDSEIYYNIIEHYTELLEILVKLLRLIILGLSIFFVIAILKGGTQYKKWMAFFNPILILLVVASTLYWSPAIAKHLAPIAMNVTHFILFSLSLYQLKNIK